MEVLSRRGKLKRRLRGLPASPRQLERSLALLANLRDLGWYRSVSEKRPVDGDARPLAWWSYPALFWLEAKLRPEDRVFEWGSGNSTLWLAGRVGEVVSVEDSPSWAQTIGAESPANVQILSRPSRESEHDPSGAYVEAILEFPIEHFDLVVIDGSERNECARIAASRVSRNGLILFDNSDRPQLAEGLEILAEQGFYRIDFVGLLPGYSQLNCTSVLFRDPVRWLRSSKPGWLGS
jgi:hypothetical protein